MLLDSHFKKHHKIESHYKYICESLAGFITKQFSYIGSNDGSEKNTKWKDVSEHIGKVNMHLEVIYGCLG
jgi:hypothetical protein